jgi:arylsulfatase A-like enzyme
MRVQSQITAFFAFAGFVLLSLIPVACGPRGDTEISSTPTARNLVILCLDTLRTDRMSLYGHDRPTTPRIDQLAEDGVVFDLALSQSNWTVPATASLLTSLYPSEHGAGISGEIRNLGEAKVQQLRRETRTLGQILSEAGFRTGMLSANPYLFGRFKRGFDVAEVERTDATTLTDRALTFLDTVEGEPFFLYIQYMDLHQPLWPPEPFFSMFGKEIPGPRGKKHTDWRFGSHEDFEGPNFKSFRSHKLALYDGALSYVDSEIGRLLDSLQQSGDLDETLIVVTSDHGEEFWDHAEQQRALAQDPRGLWGIGHGHSMYQELLRVPLVFRGPGILGGRRVECPSRLVDIVPTSLEALNLPIPEGLRGTSLSPFLSPSQGAPDCQPQPVLAESPAYGPDSRAITFGRFKLIRQNDGFVQLFDLHADPEEMLDLSAERPDLVAELTDMMERELAGIDTTASDETMEFDEDTLEQLRSLGYID